MPNGSSAPTASSCRHPDGTRYGGDRRNHRAWLFSSVDLRVYFTVDSLCMSTTIRVSEQTRDRFAKLAGATGRPMTQLLDEAADALERRVFFDQFALRYSELREDTEAWAEIEAERRVESSAVRDQSR
jgi:predicted transcriptional regulator